MPEFQKTINKYQTCTPLVILFKGCTCREVLSREVFVLLALVQEESIKTYLFCCFLFIRTISREKREVLKKDNDFSAFMHHCPEEERSEISQHFISTHMQSAPPRYKSSRRVENTSWGQHFKIYPPSVI